MLTPAQAISKLLENVRAGIIEDQEAKKIRASGASARSLKTKTKEVSGTIVGTLVGADYFYFQENGRGPAKKAKGANKGGKSEYIQSIMDWIRVKGLEQQEAEVKSFAFAIAAKQAKEGSDIYQNKRPALATEEIIEIEVEKSRPEINKAIFDYFRTETTKVLKTAFR